MTDSEYLFELGLRIKVARMRKRITGIKLAELCNIDKTNLNYIELGRINTRILTLRKIAEVLEIDIKELI